MIDRDARDRAARHLEFFLAGEITNGELFRVWPESDDEGVHRVADAIMAQVSAVTGDMFSEATAIFTMTGTAPLGPRGEERLERFLLFLRSDCEYSWSHKSASLIGLYLLALVVLPAWIGIVGYEMLWVPFLIIGATSIIPLLRVREAERTARERDTAVADGPWPFADGQEYREALAQFDPD